MSDRLGVVSRSGPAWNVGWIGTVCLIGSARKGMSDRLGVACLMGSVGTGMSVRLAAVWYGLSVRRGMARNVGSGRVGWSGLGMSGGSGADGFVCLERIGMSLGGAERNGLSARFGLTWYGTSDRLGWLSSSVFTSSPPCLLCALLCVKHKKLA